MASINPLAKVPYLGIPDKPIKALSQDHLPLADITRDLVLFKDGGAALVLESTSLNFGLLSEREQEAVVAAYASLINSLSFATQIMIRTQKKDISNYMAHLFEARDKIENPKLAGLMEGYITFISDTIKNTNVLEKRFFLVIPFSPYELGITKSFDIFGKRSIVLPYSKEYLIKKAEIALYPKRDHLVRQASRVGLHLRQLTNAELVKVYYDIYNPDKSTISIIEETVSEESPTVKEEAKKNET
jgi:hypothetical protein